MVIMGGGAGNLGFCTSFVWLKVKNLSVKADFLAGKTADRHQHALLSALGGLMWYLQLLLLRLDAPVFRRSTYFYELDAFAHELRAVRRAGWAGALKEWNNAGRRPVGVLAWAPAW